MPVAARRTEVAVRKLDVSCYTVATDFPEADGTYAWNKTTIVIVEVEAESSRGLGYTYADAAVATLIKGKLASLLQGRDAMATGACWLAMAAALRNLGRPGISAMAMAAVDIALWDLKARLLGTSVLRLLGAARDSIEVYGSGGFTSYSDEQLRTQLGRWREEGMRDVKIKIGREPSRDPDRVTLAREAIGPEIGLMVDANGAFTRKRAIEFAERMNADGVIWFEEPVSSQDLEGLRLLRDRSPAPMEVTAGEYGFDSRYFRHMLEAQAVDVLQADATRCAGITGFMKADALCDGYELPLSAHCAPALHCQPCCAAKRARHIEGFHDHLRIEGMLFDGAPRPEDGMLRPDPDRPGLGLEFKHADAARFAV